MSMTVKAAVAAIILSTASPVLAAPAMQSERTQMRAQRAVFICATDVTTRRAFERQHGAAPIFVTAREAVAANAARERWSAPRCMTEREHQRFVQLNTSMASAR